MSAIGDFAPGQAQAQRGRAQAIRGGTRFVFTPTAEPCGVETFARTLLDALGEPQGAYSSLAVSGRWRDFPHLAGEVMRADQLVFNFPLIAWKRLIVQPILLLLLAALTRRRISVFLHEWTALHGLRRLLIAPFLLLGDSIVVVSPYIANQVKSDRWLGRTAKAIHLLAHPPTVRRPQEEQVTARVRDIEAAASRHDIVIGTFGSIYKGKSSNALLDVCAELNGRNVRALIVYIGDFTHSLDGYEDEFRKAVAAKGVQEHVVVTGYVKDEGELFALFRRMDTFLFLFPEGLTARRSSVIACLQSNRPVIVSAPLLATEFDHHTGLKTLIAEGSLGFVPTGASISQVADQLLAAAGPAAQPATRVDVAAWWQATIDGARSAMGEPKV